MELIQAEQGGPMALLALTGVQSANELIWRLPGDSPLPPTPPLPTQEGADARTASCAPAQRVRPQFPTFDLIYLCEND